MNIPDFPECQLPAPTIIEEPGFRQANSKTSPLQSGEARPEEDAPFTPGQTSTSVTSTMQTKASLRLWVPTEEAEEEQSPQHGIEVDDGVPMNRSDSFRNLSTLIAWEKDAEINIHPGDNSLTRQHPQQPSICFSMADQEAVLPGTPFSLLEHNKDDPLNKQHLYAQSEKSEDALSESEGDESVIEDDNEKPEKIPLRKRLMRKLRKKFRSKKKDKEQQLN